MLTSLSLPAPRALPAATALPLPKGPVFGWRSLAGARDATLPWVGSLLACVPTTSGRAALYQALQQLQLSPGDAVLVPSYHCPTMVAPVVCAGLQPRFFAIGPDGLPRLDLIDAAQRSAARAIIVAHYFGMVHNLDPVRAWCDEHGIALIEDCAHALFGAADGQTVGRWGDFCTASISKFLPVSEMGLLASARRPVVWAGQTPGARAQLKCAVDVLEKSSRHGRPAGLALALRGLFFIKNRKQDGARPVPDVHRSPGAETAAELQARMLIECDMGRVDQAPGWAARVLHRLLPRQRMVSRRQRNFDLYRQQLQALPGAHALVADRPVDSAPYVYPLWVDDADRVYQHLRDEGMPVFRWDRVWPHAQVAPDDRGPAWSRHVLQLLCHQDLSAADVRRVAASVRLGIERACAQTPRP